VSLGAKATAEQLRTWRGHPCLAFSLRASAFAAPVVVSFVASGLAAKIAPRPDGVLASVLWWVLLLGFSTVVLVATDRLARRLLPLVALLKLSLVFPDAAPSRFGFALRSGTTKQLQRRIEQFQMEGPAAAGAADLLALIAALNVHDPRTRGHSERVRAFSDLLGEQIGLSDAERERLHWAALLHDIGKLAVPAEILNKAGKPTDEEWTILKTHPDEGVKLVVGPIAEWLGEWAYAIGEHHEKFDGTGYPKGLVGHEISLAGRLVAVADVFDVITAARSYKKPITAQEARLELVRCAGTHFDPEMVRAFLDVSIGSLRRAMGPMTWLLQLATLGRAVEGARAAGVAAAGAATLAAGFAVGVVPSPLALAAPPTPSRPTSIPDASGGQPPNTGSAEAPDRATTGASVRPSDAAGGESSSTGLLDDEGTDHDATMATPTATTTGEADPAVTTGSASTTASSTPGATTSTVSGVSPRRGPSGSAVPSTNPPTTSTSSSAQTTSHPTSTSSTSATSPTSPTSTTSSTSPISTTSTPPGATPTTKPPVSSIPPGTVPGSTVPPIALPGVSIPGITVPPISLPGITVPPISLPGITVPPITLPPITVPPITLPGITVPPITLPPITVPPITLPPITVPPITLPPITLPPVTLPPITLPPITLPHF